ncbi:MAG: D-alanyl-D-alanine carboxypeptidase/D-alanyl-D-alanine-endopeptidase [Rhodothermales bacterium]|nr:D-alanyl-D-alanine carboxypeptidase/D-alanyl-D-alanine-endopeptidase [Rhodothermales bacterium]
MNNDNRLLAAFFGLTLVAAGCATTAPTSSPEALSFGEASVYAEALLSRTDLSNAYWGIRFVRLDNGTEVYTHNESTSFVPASNTKLYTTAAAIDQLSEDFRFVTPVFAAGEVQDGVLRGDLVIRGSGDPSIGGRFHDGDRIAIFRQWAQKLRESGIERISGTIVGDDTLFDDLPLGSGWMWDDETYSYSAQVGALSFNDNCIDVSITGTTPGKAAEVSWEPFDTPYAAVTNRTLTVVDSVETEESYFRPRASNRFTVSSTVHPGDTITQSLSIHNPTEYFVSVLRSVLIDSGISVDGYAVDIDDWSPPEDARPLRKLFEHESPSLAELAAVVNKRSHNLYAEQILRALGGVVTTTDATTTDSSDPDKTTAELGIDAATRTWAAAGIDTSRIQLVDGSGLSRYNLVTARMTSKLLEFMWHGDDAGKRSAFLESLSVGGVDGTIGSRFRSPAMSGRVMAKTGTVSNVSSLSGYVTTNDGIPLAFTIMSNNFTVETDTVRTVQDKIVTAFTFAMQD